MVEPGEKSLVKRGYYAKFQVRCGGCGRFAKIIDSGDGRSYWSDDYDPWWVVDCKRCGEQDGMIGEY